MSIEINREVLENALDSMDLHCVMITLDSLYKNEVDYLKAYSNPLNSAKEKKMCKNKITFFRGMRMITEDYLVKTFSLETPEQTNPTSNEEEAVPVEQ